MAVATTELGIRQKVSRQSREPGGVEWLQYRAVVVVALVVAEDNSTDTLTGRRHKSTRQMTQIHKLNWPQIRHLNPDKYVFCFQCSSPPRRLSVRDMFILPPRIRVNIRPAALLYAVSVSQNIPCMSHPSPLEVLEMLMVMGLRYANSELQIQH